MRKAQIPDGITILEVLGSGGFCDVFRAKGRSGECALKVLRDCATEPLERFTREVEITSAIQHPNIVVVYEYQLDRPPFFYTMPVASNTLGGLSDFDPDKAFGDIVAGLTELHSRQIFHRDLKPSNVLVYEDRFCLSDLGLIHRPSSPDSKLTKTGQGMGTMYYASPEQMGGAKYLTQAADVYSLGRLAYWYVTSEDIHFAPECLPKGWRDLILKACSSDLTERHCSASSFLTALRRCLKDPGKWETLDMMNWILRLPESRLFRLGFESMINYIAQLPETWDDILNALMTADDSHVMNFFDKVSSDMTGNGPYEDYALEKLCDFVISNDELCTKLRVVFKRFQPVNAWVLEQVLEVAANR